MNDDCDPIIDGHNRGLRVHEAVLDTGRAELLFRESAPEENRRLTDFEDSP